MITCKILCKIEQDNCFIIQEIDKISTYFAVYLSQLTKLRISQNTRYVRMTNIESNMTIFGQCSNLLNNKLKYLEY